MSRAEQRAQTRARIIDAAVTVFSDHGFRGASTREIAQHAGVTQGLLTYHFSSKDELWRAAADRIFTALKSEVVDRTASQPTGDARADARAAIRDYVVFAAAHPELVRFMVEEGKVGDARMRWLVETHLAEVYAAFGALATTIVPGATDGEVASLYYVLAGAASLMFAIAPECETLTGVDPAGRVAAHADLVARLLVPE